jgi:hypothetical protein
LHCCASIDVPTHAFVPHDVPFGASYVPTHIVRLAPSHTGVAQPLPAGQGVRVPWGAPMIATHVPCSAATSHASHSPVHAAEQQ